MQCFLLRTSLFQTGTSGRLHYAPSSLVCCCCVYTNGSPLKGLFLTRPTSSGPTLRYRSFFSHPHQRRLKRRMTYRHQKTMTWRPKHKPTKRRKCRQVDGVPDLWARHLDNAVLPQKG
ncbi:hypothetical protein TGDOM2_361460 [Toxoplasma gondii GAB2-2007-GAL-DOM2]|uniref:Uncharacterized protein n=2 Tax=Toxoplasma gondii TaxID=5811 RepID=V4Z5B4_TOXGV|nr:hypothetical protein TGVEG_361460 [Toxoplasma gondii VEG]KFG37055.1 hypothetical protein TGDOM2_361460 [Toxoplasma gondii GAB2-2007-GAL-DOM2]